MTTPKPALINQLENFTTRFRLITESPLTLKKKRGFPVRLETETVEYSNAHRRECHNVSSTPTGEHGELPRRTVACVKGRSYRPPVHSAHTTPVGLARYPNRLSTFAMCERMPRASPQVNHSIGSGRAPFSGRAPRAQGRG